MLDTFRDQWRVHTGGLNSGEVPFSMALLFLTADDTDIRIRIIFEQFLLFS